MTKIHYQCSNCGKQEQTSAMVGVPHGMYYLGYRANGDALYCPDCVKSWKERNGKEFDEQYKDPQHLFAMWWNKQVEAQAEDRSHIRRYPASCTMHSYPANDPAAILQQNVRKSLAISGVQSEYVTTKNKGGSLSISAVKPLASAMGI